jgi:pSer/pThr/pTyr-binding forkhead associated (FHA) protein
VGKLLGKRAQLRIEVEGLPDQPIFLEIEESVVFGRGNPATAITPYLDLTPYEAQKKGVSREHLALTKEGNTLKVADLDSTNGTFLNGIRLYPHQPRILRSGDQLVLGQLALKILTMG